MVEPVRSPLQRATPAWKRPWEVSYRDAPSCGLPHWQNLNLRGATDVGILFGTVDSKSVLPLSNQESN